MNFAKKNTIPTYVEGSSIVYKTPSNITKKKTVKKVVKPVKTDYYSNVVPTVRKHENCKIDDTR